MPLMKKFALVFRDFELVGTMSKWYMNCYQHTKTVEVELYSEPKFIILHGGCLAEVSVCLLFREFKALSITTS